jgi:predicted ester cyclase
MSLEENKALARRMYAAFNDRDLDALDELLAADFVDRTATLDQAPGVTGFKKTWAWFHTAFPDVQIFVEDMIAEGEKVATYVTFRGIQPQREHTALRGRMIEIIRIVDGKVTELWNLHRVT